MNIFCLYIIRSLHIVYEQSLKFILQMVQSIYLNIWLKNISSWRIILINILI